MREVHTNIPFYMCRFDLRKVKKTCEIKGAQNDIDY